MLELTLPWPPTVNTYYRSTSGKVLISSEGRAYCKAVADQVLIQHGAKHLECRLSVSIVAHVPDKRRRDLDNILKSLLDSMTRAGVWADDSQIDNLIVQRGPVGGMVKVTIVEAA
jgi:crossover junction endodeoxyribonuclease RusA